jgi:hypothetical protein
MIARDRNIDRPSRRRWTLDARRSGYGSAG